MFGVDIEIIESVMTNFAIAILFLLIGLAINDVLKKGDVPRFGKIMVWFVLTLGMVGFIAKGLIQFFIHV